MSIRRHAFPRFSARMLLLLAVVATAGCGSGGSTGPAPAPAPPPPPPVVGSIVISPRGLTLPPGGQGQLNAQVLSSAGSGMSGVTVSWSSRNAVVATVSSAGVVAAGVVGQTQVIAAASGKADTVDVVVIDQLTLTVTPPGGTVAVGGTIQFDVVARNGSGAVVAAPPVTWSSSSPGVATISAGGVATGVAAGVTGISASGGGATSPAVTLTITAPPTGPCNGVTGVTTFEGTIDYGYTVNAVSQGGFRVTADDRGQMKATMTLKSTGPFLALWHGDAIGTASITQTSSDGTATATMSGGGPIVPQGAFGHPQMSFIVDLQRCTYVLRGGAVIPYVFTDANGTKQSLLDFVALVQYAAPLGAWRLGLFDDVSLVPHSIAWATQHPDATALMPLGFAATLFDGTATEPSVGTATGSMLVIVK